MSYVKTAVLSLSAALLAMLVASSLNARDNSPYAEYLGTQLRMFDEAERILRRQIESGTADEKRAARVSLAKVIKQKADENFQNDGKDSDRDRLYDEVLKVFGEEPKEGTEKVELAVLRMDLARTLARDGKPSARALAEAAKKALEEETKRLEGIRNAWTGPGYIEDQKDFWPLYVRAGFEYCNSFYVLALTWPRGSNERRDWIGRCTSQIMEFQFSVNMGVELIDSMILKGDLQLAMGEPEGAVKEFLEVPGALSIQPVNYTVGYHALRGYLRAVEVLTRDLGEESTYLQRVKDLYLEAWARYGKVAGLETEFKRFNLHRIAAMIKLGEDLEATLKDLFVLARDPDASFKRQALAVLAEISVRPGLDVDTRFNCAREVARDSEDVSQLLRVAQAFQMLLAQCTNADLFERYAPAAYSRVGDIYERLFRFLDAAIVYREAAYRCGYFRKKFGGADENQPEAGIALGDANKHMHGMCDLITDTRTAYDFPLNMGKAFLKVANWLASRQYGDQNSEEFKKLVNEANLVVASYGDQDQLYENQMRLAGIEMGKNNWAQAAVRYVKIPSVFKKYALCLDNAARCYRELAIQRNSARVNTRGASEEIESDDFFAEQRARHAADLERLPRQMWEGLEKPHWDAITSMQTAGDLANWHKSVYYYQKYFMFLVMREWDRVARRIEPDSADWADAMIALCESKHEDWLKIPAAQRKPDGELRRYAFSLYNFALLLRTPPATVVDTANDKARSAMQDTYRPLAVKLLKRLVTLFEPHFRLDPTLTADELKLNRDFTRSSLDLTFYALVDAQDADGAESVLTLYRDRFNPANEKDAREQTALRKRILDMVGRVYGLMLTVYEPRNRALSSAANTLRGLFNQMKLGLFADRIGPKYPEAAKRLEQAKGQLARDRALAQHFWEDWLVQYAFSENPDVKELLSAELTAAVKAKWDELAESYPARWAKAVRQDFDSLIKRKDFDGIREEANKLLAGVKDADVLDKLQERAKGTDGAASQFSTLATQMYLNTAHLRYFTGTVFIYEFGGFLDNTAADLESRLRPMMTKVLTYYEVYQQAKQEDTGGAATLTPAQRLALGKQYFRVRDWERAISYFQPYYDERVTAKAWGDRSLVPINQAQKRVGLTTSGEELELCYQLGQAYFQRFRQNDSVDDLKRAAVLMRRAYAFVQVRNTNEMARNVRQPYELTFKTQMENNYLDIVEGMAEIYLALHRKGGPKVDFMPAADQLQANLEPLKEKDKQGKEVAAMQAMPGDEAGYLWASRRIRLDTWAAFYRLDDHPWRSEYRDNVMAWVRLTTQWLTKYGDKGMNVAELSDAKAVAAEMTQVRDVVRRVSEPSGHFEDEGTLAFKSEVKKAGEELEAAAAKAGVKLGG